MMLRIEVDGTPISAVLDSVTIERELNGRTSKAAFKMRVGAEAAIGAENAIYDTAVYDTDSYYPALPSQQSEVIIYNADTEEKKFRGTVVNISREIKSAAFQFWAVTCAGLEYLLENVTVNDEWTATKPRAIIQDAFGSLLPEILTTNATVEDLGEAIDLKAKDMTLRALLDRLAEIADAEYYVTPEKELVFRAAGSVDAPFGFDGSPDLATTYAYDSITSERDSVGFANRVIALGGFFGTLGAELRSQADNMASQTSLGRVVEAIVTARDINNQEALDLFAQIELETRGGVQEYVKLRTFHGGPVAARNIPDTLDVGMVVPVQSVAGGILGDFKIQSIAYKLKTPTWTVVELALGDYKRKLHESQRRLEKIRVNPLVPPVPPPPDSITNEMVNNVNFSKVVMDVLIQSSDINTINFAQVTGVTITDSMITSVSFSKVTGTVTVAASNITGSLNFSQVNSATVSITNSMLAGSIDFSKIDSLTISITNSMLAGGINITGSQIANLTITDGNIANNTISSAKIVSLDVGKLTAGTITAAIAISSGGSLSCSGPLTVGGSTTITGTFTVSGLANTINNGLTVNNGLTANGVGGSVTLGAAGAVDASGSYKIGGTTVINGSLQFVGAGVDVGTNGVGCGGVNITSGGVVNIGGVQVLTARQSSITSASTSHSTASFGDVDTALNALGTAINAVINRLQTHGLIS